MDQFQDDYKFLVDIKNDARNRILEAVKNDDEEALAVAEHNFATAMQAMQSMTLVSVLDGISKTLSCMNSILLAQNDLLRTQVEILHNARQMAVRRDAHKPDGVIHESYVRHINK